MHPEYINFINQLILSFGNFMYFYVFFILFFYNSQVTLGIAIGALGYFINKTRNVAEKLSPQEGGDIFQSFVDLGGGGRHEFFFSAVVIGLFTAVLSLVIAITNHQEQTHWAANVSSYLIFFQLRNNCCCPTNSYQNNLSNSYIICYIHALFSIL